ncbi:MAG: hypothetical protein ABF311_08900, partial [Polaribacter sp.]
MRFYKIISTLFHPIVIPTIGIIIYFIATIRPIGQYQKLITIFIVFGSTYIIPLLLLITLKKTGVINSYQLKTRKERKIPLAIM